MRIVYSATQKVSIISGYTGAMNFKDGKDIKTLIIVSGADIYGLRL